MVKVISEGGAHLTIWMLKITVDYVVHLAKNVSTKIEQFKIFSLL